MSLWSKLFGAKKPRLTTQQEEQVAAALLLLLRPQVEGLGYQLESVPMTPELTSLKARGYLYGLSAGVLKELDLIAIGGDTAVHTLDATYSLVFGPDGRQFTNMAAQGDSKDPDFKAASQYGIVEVEAIFANSFANQAGGLLVVANGLM